jgi:Suppressor of fused protein (SUFU)
VAEQAGRRNVRRTGGYRSCTVSAPGILGAVERFLCDHFGQLPKRASVSFVGVDPIEVLRFEPIPGELAYLTLGMSGRPMTSAVEVMLSSDGPRAELMLHVRDAGQEYADAWRQLAVLAAAPTVEGVVYRTDMTVDLGAPMAARSRCSGGVLDLSPVGPIATPAGEVEVLQLVPATQAELAWCRVRGAAALRERWIGQHVDLLDLGRRAASLD